MPADCEKRMPKVLDRIHEDPGADLSLDTLAEVAVMSPYHRHRVFRAVTGETLAEAVRRIRLQRAACWLVQTDLKLPVIAGRAGYGSVRSLSRAFRAHHGVTPAAFRARGSFVPASLYRDPIGVPLMFPVDIRDQPARRAPRGDAGHRPLFEALDAYDALYCTWLPNSGEEPGPSPAFEVYRNTPRDTAPDKLRTDIMLPLA